MKRIALSLVAVLISGSAFAQAGTGVGVGIGTSGAISNAGSNLSIGPSYSKIPQQAPGIAVQASNSAIESCNNSAGLGFSVAGFGLGGSLPVMDEHCDDRLYARTLATMGRSDAGLRLLATNPKIAAALNGGVVQTAVLPVQRASTIAPASGGAIIPLTHYASAQTDPAPAGYTWAPNPEYASWQAEQAAAATAPARRRARR